MCAPCHNLVFVWFRSMRLAPGCDQALLGKPMVVIRPFWLWLGPSRHQNCPLVVIRPFRLWLGPSGCDNAFSPPTSNLFSPYSTMSLFSTSWSLLYTLCLPFRIYVHMTFETPIIHFYVRLFYAVFSGSQKSHYTLLRPVLATRIYLFSYKNIFF